MKLDSSWRYIDLILCSLGLKAKKAAFGFQVMYTRPLNHWAARQVSKNRLLLCFDPNWCANTSQSQFPIFSRTLLPLILLARMLAELVLSICSYMFSPRNVSKTNSWRLQSAQADAKRRNICQRSASRHLQPSGWIHLLVGFDPQLLWPFAMISPMWPILDNLQNHMWMWWTCHFSL